MIGILSGPVLYFIWRRIYGGLSAKDPVKFPINKRMGLATKISENLHSWLKTIIFALAAGAYTGTINQIPVLQNTSFDDIAVTYEAWVLFGTLIAINCKKPLEAGLKVFVFFLISQILCFTVEIPTLGFSQSYFYFTTCQRYFRNAYI